MESTGSYWKPIYAVLEDSGIEVVVANGEDVKARRGHKTDWNDCRFVANLLRHGLVRASFIPPQAIRDLRDLTRRRRQLIGDATSERNRVQKAPEEANIRLGSVLSDLFGVSGQLMLEKTPERRVQPGSDRGSRPAEGAAEDPGDPAVARRKPHARPPPGDAAAPPGASGVSRKTDRRNRRRGSSGR